MFVPLDGRGAMYAVVFRPAVALRAMFSSFLFSFVSILHRCLLMFRVAVHTEEHNVGIYAKPSNSRAHAAASIDATRANIRHSWWTEPKCPISTPSRTYGPPLNVLTEFSIILSPHYSSQSVVRAVVCTVLCFFFPLCVRGMMMSAMKNAKVAAAPHTKKEL